MIRFTLLLALSAPLVCTGCGGSDTSSAAASPAGPVATGQSQAQQIPTDQSERVVYEFLEALRQGKTNVANARLTPIAHQLLERHDRCIVMPASETASFRVGTVEQHDAQRATVDAVWSDLDVDGNRYNEQTLWALRLIEGKWRISGMVSDIESENPVACDFENPAEYAQPSQTQTPDITRQAQQPAVDPFKEGVKR
ncbi:hypothetical protein [Adhaeretor mobilis]|uniref:DUF3828 domain-containing protein n=1 Tax=Adhaeretor mobilis TaxID=1930276 RepID=A0A517MT30_9BACT|nr:hypothetical protein [Adhaeretor mobilis]QDS98041.1 hypothetical protein HG15A2_13110 [Adhaeretor mobilis]